MTSESAAKQPPSEKDITVADEDDDYDEDDTYDSGEDDGEDDDVGDGDYQEDDDGQDEDDEGDEGDAGKGENLTHLLIAKNDDEGEEDEEDGTYVPGGGVEPAEQEVDGDAHDDDMNVNGEAVSKGAVGLKRKTSGDAEDDGEEALEEDQDAKRVKV